MSKSRIKLKAPVIQTREQMEALVGDIAFLKIKEAAFKSEMDEQLQAVRKTYESHLAKIETDLAPKMEMARAWAEANPSEFNGAKSLELLHGSIGWRLGQPQAKTMAGWTWDRVLEKIKFFGAAFTGYIRTKEEVNKQQLIIDRETLGAEQLRLIGVKIVQDEAFFVEPKMTETQPRETT